MERGKECVYCSEVLPVDVNIDNPAEQFVLCEACLEAELMRYQPKKKVDFTVSESTATNLLFHDEDPSRLTFKIEQNGIAYFTGGQEDLRLFFVGCLKRLESFK